jgi:hypothetical protein
MPRKTKEDPDGLIEDWERIRRRAQKSYVGRRSSTGRCSVQVVEGSVSRKLSLARNVRNHSMGFDWGYGGSGPSQLALAILCDHLHDTSKAIRLYQDFKTMVVERLPKDGWALPETIVEEAVKMLENSVSHGVSKESEPSVI